MIISVENSKNPLPSSCSYDYYMLGKRSLNRVGVVAKSTCKVILCFLSFCLIFSFSIFFSSFFIIGVDVKSFSLFGILLNID